MELESIWQKKEVKLAIIALGSVLVIWLGMATWLSKIQITQKNIEQFAKILETSCTRRLDLLPQLGQIMLEAKVPEGVILTQGLKQVYDKNKGLVFSMDFLNDPLKLEAFFVSQKEVVNAFLSIDRQAPHIPSLANNQSYFNLFRQLEVVDAQILFAQLALNRQIAIYNSIVGGKPQKWINQIYPRYPLKNPVLVPTFNEFAHGKSS